SRLVSPALFECAVTLLTDPDAAWEQVQRLPHESHGLDGLLMVAAVAESRGDAAIAREFSERAANTELLWAHVRMALRLGLHRNVQWALEHRAPGMGSEAAIGAFGEGLHVELTAADVNASPHAVTEDVLDRFACHASWALLRQAVGHRYNPRTV